LIALDPPVAIWGLSMIYALSGPVQHLRGDQSVYPAEDAEDAEHAKTDLH
jgi:hypothetical protein